MILKITLVSMLLCSPVLVADDTNKAGFQRIEEKTWELFHATPQTENPHAPPSANPHEKPAEDEASAYYGIVEKIQQSGGYTYILLETSDGPVWAATAETELKKGDKIRLNDAFPMHNFHAKSLKKTFDIILFAGSITKAP